MNLLNACSSGWFQRQEVPAVGCTSLADSAAPPSHPPPRGAKSRHAGRLLAARVHCSSRCAEKQPAAPKFMAVSTLFFAHVSFGLQDSALARPPPRLDWPTAWQPVDQSHASISTP